MRNAVRVLRKLVCCGVVALAAGGMVRQATARPGGVSGAAGNGLRKSAIYADLSNDPYLYFPTADEKDARFVAIVGNGLASLGDQVLSTKLAVPRGASELEVGVFDGDTGGIWDVGTTPVTFTLYADPLNTSSTSVLIHQWTSTQMADNAWTTLRVPLSDFQNLAQGPSGHYFFNLVIASTNPADTSLNAFKLRARGTVALRPTAFSITAQVRLLAEAQTVYPAYPAVTPTTNDGQWNFFMDVPSTPEHFEIWDGDMDYGSASGSTLDTADPDTATSSDLVTKTSPTGVAKLIPSWANPAYVNAEGAKGKGNPADDAASPLIARTPSVEYDVIDAKGTSYTNSNPSGTEEWERFRIDTAPFDRTKMDYHADQLPAGVYQMRLRGLDLSNLCAIKLDYDALGVSRNGLPGKPLRAFELGDTVWLDVNGDGVWQNNDNGIAEAGEEPGVSNVVVNLVDGSGNVVETTKTDANGHYRFEVDNGNYLVEVGTANFQEGGVLHGLLSTTGGDVLSGAINNASDFSFDFGYHPRSGLASCVWLDSNRNGIVDAGEPGISGVTVRAYRVDPVQGLVLVGTSVTNATGTFGFADLPAAAYELQVDPTTLPAGLVATSDADGLATLNTARVAIMDGEVAEVECFGYAGIGSIGDKVWCDDNQNGQQDASDPGIGAVRLTLKSAQIHAEVTTDGTGYYSFAGLPVGTYTVEVDTRTLPLNRVFVLDRDGIITPGTTLVALGGTTMNVDDADFGYCGTGTIGDTVWLDSNRNGLQDPNETGIPGATVYILGDLDGDGAPDYYRSRTTDSQGRYLFTNLFIGDYLVSVDAAPLGLDATYDLDGLSTPDTTVVVLGAFSTVNLNADFGYLVRPSSVGDRVWKDLDFDGEQDQNEAGVAGVTVQLLNASGATVATTTTDAEGKYLFEGLSSGDYSVILSGVPAGFSPSFDLDGVATADKAAFTLGPGANKRDVDFGYGYNGSVGDTIWLDADLNGAQNGGESGISGITVTLQDGSGTVVATTTTDGNGKYLFNRLAPGTYSVLVSALPAGTVQTYDLDGVGSANKATFTLGAGVAKLDVDFGYGRPASVGDRVWLDANRNGVQDSGEAGISGVTVTLLNSNGAIVATQTTNDNGLYLLDGLVPGNYSITVSGLPAGSIPTFDLDGVATANKASFGLVGGEAKRDVDFGYAPPFSSVGDRVWLDANGNGVQESGEAGISGVTVKLLNSNGVTVATKTTDGSGLYLFDQLEAGNYTVAVTAPSTLTQTWDLDGVSTAGQASFSLVAGEAKRDVDFGYQSEADAGDFTTYTQGGWGTTPKGNNPGQVLKSNFSRVFPSGVKVGGKYTLTFTSSTAVADFLPQGGTASKLTSSATNPKSSSAGVLAGQVLSMQLSLSFSNAGVTRSGLGSLKLRSGKFAGYTLTDFCSLANRVLGGDISCLPSGATIADVNDAATKVNENFDNGTTDKGFLR